jgi:hypothetical protein
VYAVLFVLSLFLLSFPGDYWPWYMAMVPFAIIPLLLGPRGYRIAGGVSLALSLLLIMSDIEAGKQWHAKREHKKRQNSVTKIEPGDATDGRQPVRPETNRTSSATGSRR